MRRTLAALSCVLPLAAFAAAPAPPPGGLQAPEAVVRAFNADLSGRRLDSAIAAMAPGAVSFNIGSAHGFSTTPATEPLTSDLAIHWRTVAPVLYGASKRYERRVEQASTHMEGALAVVWARLRTTTERKDGTTTTLEFSETYLLKLERDRWRIIGVASARPTR